MLWALSGCCIDSNSNIMSRNLINFIFAFPATLITKIAQSLLHYSPISLVLKLLYILSTLFLAYGSFVTVYSMTIFEKAFLNPVTPRVQNQPFSFFCSN